ncbi:MAG: hydroxymethylbilane synthase [Chloroflexota bacterium]|nr:hydroxymethylbilane synthase [Chloroflexota bacterium]
MRRNGHIRVGSRRSKLAITQSQSVITELVKVHPDLEFELIEVVTTGDRHRQISLEELGGEGVFVRELEQALEQNRIDLAVHSAKDMPTKIAEGLRLAAISKRVDPRDVIVSRSGKLSELASGARVGTGSQRRAVQLRVQRPDVEVCGLRGNVDTRLRKVSSGELDAVLLAAAALIRLGMEDRITESLDPDSFTPAVGQGALGIEIRADDVDMAEIVAPLNHESTWLSVLAERAFLEALGGGCRAPIAALGNVDAGVLHMHGIVANPSGSDILRAEVSGGVADPESVGRMLAQKMMEIGAASLVERKQI